MFAQAAFRPSDLEISDFKHRILGRLFNTTRNYLAALAEKCEPPVFTGSRRFRNDLYFKKIISAFSKRFCRCFRVYNGAGEAPAFF
jgi:hypothetical protein